MRMSSCGGHRVMLSCHALDKLDVSLLCSHCVVAVSPCNESFMRRFPALLWKYFYLCCLLDGWGLFQEKKVSGKFVYILRVAGENTA